MNRFPTLQLETGNFGHIFLYTEDPLLAIGFLLLEFYRSFFLTPSRIQAGKVREIAECLPRIAVDGSEIRLTTWEV